ncbi:MAG: site-2 protease family protein [Chloroflexi bacterium]|nr:site-2 protease family protein [Chloroflexota bacterium]
MQRYTPRDILVLAVIAGLFIWYYGGRSFGRPETFLLFIAVLILAVTVHEFSHAFVALQLGDWTAKTLGRVSLNPIRHLDLFGSLAFLFFGFGWGKPVPINPYQMKGVSPMVGAAISALAGPTSNVLFALVATIPFRLEAVSRGTWEMAFLQQLIGINILLAAFNFLPIPPLDGFSLARLILPRNVTFFLEQYGMFVLLALVFVPQFLGPQADLIGPVMGPLRNFIQEIVFFGM